MRVAIWTCRVIMVVVIAAFVATVFYMTHDVGTDMDSSKPALNLITVIGTALLGLVWPLMRRYWQALILLVSLGVFRGLFGTGPGLSSIEAPLLTPFQSDYLWVSIGVVALALVASLVVRAVVSDRALRVLKQTQSTWNPALAVAGAPAEAAAPTMVPPASLVVADSETVAMPATEAEESRAVSEPVTEK
jgi:hypothetical protein